MKKEKKEIDVKEFLDELNSLDAETPEDKIDLKPKKREKTEYSYSVVVASGCDIVINRTSKRVDKSLCLFFSKRLYFIYDEKNNTKKDITDPKQLRQFFPDKTADELLVPADTLGYAKAGIRKSECDDWWALLNTPSDGVSYLIKRNLIQLSDGYHRGSYRCEDIDLLYQKSPKLLAEVLKLSSSLPTPAYRTYSSSYSTLYALSSTYAIASAYDVDTAYYFLQKLEVAPIAMDYNNSFTCSQLEALKEFNLDGRRFVDYFLFDIYKQGLTMFPFETYLDYLKQQKSYYGKVKDKYPENLKAEHDIITKKVTDLAEHSVDSPKFAEIMEEAEDFSYKNSYDKFCIVMPAKSADLVEEGRTLGHCVASYVSKVVDGDCLVVFMREKESPDTPYLTVEILPDRSLSQVEGEGKRSTLSYEEKLFLYNFAKFKHLKITAANAALTKFELEKLKEKGKGREKEERDAK